MPAVSAGLLALWLGGLVWFANRLPEPVTAAPEMRVDGIVVLTGGNGRIQAGLASLKAGTGKRLLISGVNRDLATETIRRAIGGDDSLFDCCIDLGREALDTGGNADETATWAALHGYRTLQVVTAANHMPRSLVEFHRRMPDLDLVPHPVADEARPSRLAVEYTKYLAALLRDRLL